MANSTSPTATPSTTRQVPIRTPLRCFRVMTSIQARPQADRAAARACALPLNWLLARCKRLQRVVLPVEHAIGSDQLEPAGKIAAVLVEPGGEPLHHLLDHRLALGRAHGLAPRRRRNRSGRPRAAAQLCGEAGVSTLGHRLAGKMRFVGGDPLSRPSARQGASPSAPCRGSRASPRSPAANCRPAPWRWRAGCAAR